METIYVGGAFFIQWLQKHKTLHTPLIWASHIGSPLMSYAIIFPAAYYINPVLGLVTILCAAFTEWLSGLLKWVLHGHRPYWWVHLHAEATQSPVIALQQFPSTCETGPGSPSGHCMITLAALLPLVVHLFQTLPGVSRYLLLVCVSLFVVALSLSRCYLAAHFPHQVATGVVAGLLLGHLFYQASPLLHALATRPNSAGVGMKTTTTTSWLDQLIVGILRHPTSLVLYGLGSFALAWLFACSLQLAFGLDINWSIRLAKHACQRPEWARISSSLLVGFARIAGYLFGLYFALLLNPPTRESLTQAVPHMASLICFLLPVLVGTKAFEAACGHVINSLSELASRGSEASSVSGPGLLSLATSCLQASMGPMWAVAVLPRLIGYLSRSSTSEKG